jgi:type II secretory pathway pseudopilin PulG
MPKGKKNSGFSLIEILISLLFIGALVTILFTTTGSLFTRRQSDLQSVAAKIATKEIEYLRGLDFSTLKSKSGTINCPPGTTDGITPADFNNLRAGCMAREITDYATPPSQKIYKVKVTINWRNDNNANKSLQMETLISENGL